MSLHPDPIGEVPAETVRVARAAFPKGTVVTRLRNEFSALFEDEDFQKLYPARGQPGLAPWRLALVTGHRQLGCRPACEMRLSRVGGRDDDIYLPELRRLPFPG